ncbi:MAG: hypothetical protein U9R14_04715 [Patescibacteria group bacterium]|nr:hypothetical protein [Patescibacteria group bacterium]
MDTITAQIKCSSDFCDELRKERLFFITIAEALGIDREDVIELDD